MTQKYHHHKIEAKWQNYWEKESTFKTDIKSDLPKYYILDMFPYPSGAGLHVGHVTGYTATDVIARYHRQKGFNVLHPMGWDSFGLPAEQYAIRTGVHPAISTRENINTYRRQLKKMGFSYDWSREIATSEPDYYKWTQWIFTEIYRKGLAYEAEMLVNYCPALGTVVSNEEIEDGKTKEGGYPIERRPLRQWILKITAYAERLVEDLDLVDWPENVKTLQKNWIGKSHGAQIHFKVENSEYPISVFTTRPDTLFGVTYLVLAPEHPLIATIQSDAQKEQIAAYQKHIASKSDLERTELSQEKTGVFTGAYAINPVNEERIPIWISDYVLMGYGTGAVMAVPAHDERDFAFANTFSLPIRTVCKPYDEEIQTTECWSGSGICINSKNSKELDLNGLSKEQAVESVCTWLSHHGHGSAHVNYKLRDWLFSRQRYWAEPFPILHFADGTKRALDLDELPLCPPAVSDYKPTQTGESPLANVPEWINIIDPKTGLPAKRETNTMPQWAGSCWYYLRFCDPLNQTAAWDKEAERYWLPVDMYVGGVEHAVLHLLYARFWHKVLFDCGHVTKPEPFMTYRYPGIVTARSYRRIGADYVDPEEVEEKDGKYFWKKTGEELESHIEKMSKSKLNGVSPDGLVEDYGADAVRLYSLFMGPLDKEKVWQTEAISGCRRFINRFYDLAHSPKLSEQETPEANRLIHRLAKGVSEDLDLLQFNTAIAKMMEFMNGFTSLTSYPRSSVKMLAKILSSFAPHVAQEVWEILGETSCLSKELFPKYEERYLKDAKTLYVIQINGKVRAKIEIDVDLPKEQIIAIAKEQPNIAKMLDGEIQSTIFVPNKLINFVVA